MRKFTFPATAKNFLSQRNWLIIVAAVAVIFAIFTFGILAAHRIHNYSSDDVAQQTVLLNSGKYGPQEAWIGVDNFVVKLPFYQLVNSTLGESRVALLVTVVAFNTMAFIGLAATFWIIWRDKLRESRKKIALPVVLGLVAFLWVASLGSDLATSFVNPNVRNAEVGICIFLAVLALFWAKREKAAWWGTALISLLTGVLIYSDPYFLYTLFIPLAAVPAYYYFFDKKSIGAINAVRLYVLLAASFVVYKLVNLFTGALGFNVYHPDVMFAGLATLGKNILNVISSFLSIFHGNFFGQVASIDTMVVIANAALAVAFVALTIRYLIKHQFTSPYAVLFGLTIVATIVLYGISTNSDSPYTVRYLVLVPYVVLFLVPFVLAEMQNSRLKILFVGLMIVASVGNTFTMFKTAYNHGIPGELLGNTQQLNVIKQLDSHGLEKGYSGYWDGNITTYLSKGAYLTVPVVCNTQNQLQVYYWLMDDAWLNKKVSSSYLIIDAAEDTFNRCDATALESQFGAPKETIQIDTRRTLHVYDYDIYTHMPQQRADTKQP